jgi:hypothetical protein
MVEKRRPARRAFISLIFGWRDILRLIFTPPWKLNYVAKREWDKYVMKRIQDESLTEEDKEYEVIKQLANWSTIFVMFLWLYEWALSLAGFIALGIYAPYWVQSLNIPRQSQTWVVIGIATVGGLIWQLVASLQVVINNSRWNVRRAMQKSAFRGGISFGIISILLVVPFIATGIIIWWYISHFAPNHDLVNSGILGAAILKIFFTIVLPALKGLIWTPLIWLFKRIVWGPAKEQEKVPASTKVDEAHP